MDTNVEQLKSGIVTALKAERWADALVLLEAWCEQFPNHAKSWLNQGYCLYRLGRLNESVAAFDRCLELDPESGAAQGWRRRALADLDLAATMTDDPKEEPAVTAAARANVEDVTRRAPAVSQAPQSFATMAIPDTRRGWRVGTVIDGRYEVRDTARGGMAVVAIAFDRVLDRMVAIKTPMPSMLASTDGRARFQREAESWIALGIHPNICCAHYLQEIGGMPRLFIEYVDGGDLNDWLKRDQQPSLEQRLDLSIQIASGLDYTHNFPWIDDDGVEHRGLVHRDIKPANILLTTDGIARVTDFGLVRSHAVAGAAGHEDVRDQLDPKLPPVDNPQDSVATGTWQTVTAAGGLVGTPPYMAPELWRQAQRGTVATDVYAYGCLLYEVFCGQRPFVMRSDSASQTREAHLGGLMRMHLRDAPPDPLALNPDLDPSLARLMISCLAKKPEERPESFTLVRQALVAAYQRAMGTAYPRPEPRRTQLLADSLNNRGASFATLGLADRALASFREALDVDPRHLEAAFNGGLLEWRSAGLTDAELERRLGQAETSSGVTARAGLLLARLRLMLDNPQGALEAIQSVPAEASEAPAFRRVGALAMLASMRAAGGRFDVGRICEALHGVVEESPSDLPAMIALSEACRLMGDDETSDQAMNAARALDRDLPEDLDQAVATHLPGHRNLRTVGHQAPVQSVRALADGRVVVRTGGGEAFVWGVAGDRPDFRVDLGGPARLGRSMAAFEGQLVVCLENGPLTVFDLGDGRRVRTFRTHPGVATCVEISRGGKNVATGGSDRNLRIWDFESGECTQTLKGHEAFVSSVAWHPGGARVVTASADGTARLWDLDEGRCTRVLSGHNGPVRGLAVDPEGRFVTTAGQDGLVGLWDMETGENLRFLRGHRGSVVSVAVVGAAVAAGGEDGTVRLWGLEGGESRSVIRLANPILDFAVFEDDSTLVAAFGSEVSYVPLGSTVSVQLPLVLAESAASGELAERERQFQSHLDEARNLITSGAMEEAVEQLRKARSVEGYDLHDEVLELWSRALAFFPKKESRGVFETRRVAAGRAGLSNCCFTPDGAVCWVGGSDGYLRRIDVRAGVEDLAIEAHDQGVTAIAVSGRGDLVATAGRDGAVRVWNTDDGQRRYSFGGREGAIHAVVFSPDDEAVLAAGDGRVVQIWRLDETARAESLGGCDDAISTLAASADGRFLVGGGWDSMVTVWSLRKRVELRRMEGHEGTIHAVAVSPDCRLAASAGEDATVRLWDLEGGRLWRTLSGHEGPVSTVTFTPDGRSLLSAGKDNSIRLWDVRTGTSARVVKGHTRPVADVGVDRDGGAAVSVGGDGRVRFWFLDWEPELQVRGRWDDRVRPFLQVFLRRRETESPSGHRPTWTDLQVQELLEDLGRRGFGWLAGDRVEQELEGLAQHRSESRVEEQQRTREQAKRRARQVRVAPVKEIVQSATRNIGLKTAGIAAAVMVVLAVLWSLTTPGGELKFGKVYREVGLAVQARGLRLEQGMVSAFHATPSLGARDCGQELFSEMLAVVLNAENLQRPPLDPGEAADAGFRARYANAVYCVEKLGTPDIADQVLRRAAAGLHPRREEDLLGVMFHIGAARDPRVERALTDRSEPVRHLAAKTLAYGGDDNGAPELLAALEGDDRRGVEAASSVLNELICLGGMEAAEAFEIVRRFSQNMDPLVRRNAARSLVLFEENDAVDELLEILMEDSDREVAEAARVARDTIDRAG